MPLQDRPSEREAVRTTIGGGRPPGCGQDVGAIPRKRLLRRLRPVKTAVTTGRCRLTIAGVVVACVIAMAATAFGYHRWRLYDNARQNAKAAALRAEGYRALEMSDFGTAEARFKAANAIVPGIAPKDAAEIFEIWQMMDASHAARLKWDATQSPAPPARDGFWHGAEPTKPVHERT